MSRKAMFAYVLVLMIHSGRDRRRSGESHPACLLLPGAGRLPVHKPIILLQLNGAETCRLKL
jgi:hypothetical protein